MTSSVVEGGSEEAKREPSDLSTESMNLTAENLLLPYEIFLRAASSLKDKVLLYFSLCAYIEWSRTCLSGAWTLKEVKIWVWTGCGGNLEPERPGGWSDGVFGTIGHCLHLFAVVPGYRLPERLAVMQRDRWHVCHRCTCLAQVF